MEQRHRKPKVFLSHSKKDSTFIEKIDNDLRKCQIDTWLDTYEIRHGSSWQESIFEFGIPTCDAILVYFTKNSVSSTVVKKEMDVGLLQKLKDNNVAFLPYVNNANIRELLRPDIQAMQTLEWNDENYSTLLPIVVSEIWRNYLEKIIASATKDERLRRIELELEIEKNKNQTENIFSLSESAEFEYIHNSLDKFVQIKIEQKTNAPSATDKKLINIYSLQINLESLVATLNAYDKEFDMFSIRYVVLKKGKEMLDLSLEKEQEKDKYLYELEQLPDLNEQLLMWGLLETYTYNSESTSPFGRVRQKNIFSKKFFRYKYWLAYNKMLPTAIQIKKTK